MRDDEQYKNDIIDEDLYEELDEETLLELVEEERKKALLRARQEKNQKPKSPFPKWVFWLIALAMLLNVIALLPQTVSIPAIEFIKTSTRLSAQDDIKMYKEAVVVIETNDSKGTGFSIDAEGTIITNHHVIEGEEKVTVAFPEQGLFSGEVVATFPEVDLAVVKTDGEGFPYLSLADKTEFEPGEAIYFIGNPLAFNGIANEGTILDYLQLSSWPENTEVIMIEAPVYRGNSGSPIINKDGKVIGVIFATLNHDDYGKVGLFVPIDYYYEKIR
ncbi:S1C family serine protease [Ornithinibacillus halophilus]|uniref:Trypsin-like peptidase domain-containing protein n=1 Tax=Ornithinibacillus halophilus TaxID=930117 RepID=A0A1M5HXJ6_9BACI|nr:serine protease [Ornithinibacillus halophilus]SHG20688.1 Trypsin-like peptidase domain-containing protein [Ornithinibacillus halophilus]